MLVPQEAQGAASGNSVAEPCSWEGSSKTEHCPGYSPARDHKFLWPGISIILSPMTLTPGLRAEHMGLLVNIPISCHSRRMRIQGEFKACFNPIWDPQMGTPESHPLPLPFTAVCTGLAQFVWFRGITGMSSTVRSTWVRRQSSLGCAQRAASEGSHLAQSRGSTLVSGHVNWIWGAWCGLQLLPQCWAPRARFQAVTVSGYARRVSHCLGSTWCTDLDLGCQEVDDTAGPSCFLQLPRWR